MDTSLLLTTLFLVAAILYSSVGHAGASGYLAAMALVGVAPNIMKPTALVLNLLVASIATVRFARAGYFSWALLWPFALGSIPFAFIGGAMTLPGYWYKALVGILLLMSAVPLLIEQKRRALTNTYKDPPVISAVLCGCVIGLLAGLTGTGGGIFLSPLLLFAHWAETRATGGVSAAFILLNSLFGLLGNMASISFLPSAIPLWAGAVVIGGFLGTELGTRRLGIVTFRRLLGLVLVVAGGKLLMGA